MTPSQIIAAQITDLRGAHEQIYRLMEKQGQALKGRDIQAISDVSNELQAAIYELGQIEISRSEQTRELCERLSLPTDASLLDIIGSLDEPDRSRITGDALGLRSLIGEAHQLAKHNEEVILFEHSYVAGLMQEVLHAAVATADNKAAPESDQARFVDLEA